MIFPVSTTLKTKLAEKKLDETCIGTHKIRLAEKTRLVEETIRQDLWRDPQDQTSREKLKVFSENLQPPDQKFELPPNKTRQEKHY